MRLDNPARVIDNIFAFQALHLQDRVSVQSVIRSCWDAREQLQVLSEEGVARARERAEGNFVAPNGLPVQKDTISFEYPPVSLPQHRVLRLEESDELVQVEEGRRGKRLNMLQGLECVPRVEILESFGEQRVGLSFFGAVRSLQRPNCEIIVSIEEIFSVEVLQKNSEVAALYHLCVRHSEDHEDFTGVGRATLQLLSLSNRPQNPFSDAARYGKKCLTFDYCNLLIWGCSSYL